MKTVNTIFAYIAAALTGGGLAVIGALYYTHYTGVYELSSLVDGQITNTLLIKGKPIVKGSILECHEYDTGNKVYVPVKENLTLIKVK